MRIHHAPRTAPCGLKQKARIRSHEVTRSAVIYPSMNATNDAATAYVPAVISSFLASEGMGDAECTPLQLPRYDRNTAYAEPVGDVRVAAQVRRVFTI